MIRLDLNSPFASAIAFLCGVCLMAAPYCCVTDCMAEFYEKDFARVPGGVGENVPLVTATRPPLTRAGDGLKAGTTTRRGPLDARPSANQRGEKVLEIGLLVNSGQASERLVLLEQLVKSHAGIAFGPLALGGQKPSGPLLAKISALRFKGARVVAPNNPVFGGAKSVPAWVIGTASGYHLLEGLADPSAFLNDEGEFISPNTPPPSTPTPALDTEKF